MEEFTEAIELSLAQYGTLESPKFKGQTPADENGIYTVFMESEGALYKIEMKLWN